MKKFTKRCTFFDKNARALAYMKNLLYLCGLFVVSAKKDTTNTIRQ